VLHRRNSNTGLAGSCAITEANAANRVALNRILRPIVRRGIRPQSGQLQDSLSAGYVGFSGTEVANGARPAVAGGEMGNLAGKRPARGSAGASFCRGWKR
jgi:hypothetical protein